ncbi:unnamed protein product, partial [Choristocarpus tenellus]
MNFHHPSSLLDAVTAPSDSKQIFEEAKGLLEGEEGDSSDNEDPAVESGSGYMEGQPKGIGGVSMGNVKKVLEEKDGWGETVDECNEDMEEEDEEVEQFDLRQANSIHVEPDPYFAILSGHALGEVSSVGGGTDPVMTDGDIQGRTEVGMWGAEARGSGAGKGTGSGGGGEVSCCCGEGNKRRWTKSDKNRQAKARGAGLGSGTVTGAGAQTRTGSGVDTGGRTVEGTGGGSAGSNENGDWHPSYGAFCKGRGSVKLNVLLDSNTFIGTADFMAPEMVTGDHKQGTAMDWWALGVMLYELMLGTLPFSRLVGDEATFASIVNSKLTFPSGHPLSPDVLDFIKQLLHKDPSQRLGERNGVGEIRRHPFFSNVHWALIANQKPPFVVVGPDTPGWDALADPLIGGRMKESNRVATWTWKATSDAERRGLINSSNKGASNIASGSASAFASNSKEESVLHSANAPLGGDEEVDAWQQVPLDSLSQRAFVKDRWRGTGRSEMEGLGEVASAPEEQSAAVLGLLGVELQIEKALGEGVTAVAASGCEREEGSLSGGGDGKGVENAVAEGSSKGRSPRGDVTVSSASSFSGYDFNNVQKRRTAGADITGGIKGSGGREGISAGGGGRTMVMEGIGCDPGTADGSYSGDGGGSGDRGGGSATNSLANIMALGFDNVKTIGVRFGGGRRRRDTEE